MSRLTPTAPVSRHREGSMEALPAFSHDDPLTRRDLESITDERHRYELVDGTLIMSPSPRPLHQRAVARVLAALAKVCPAGCEALPAPVDVWITDDTVLIPDVVVGRREAFTERALIGAPELVVEVMSPSSEHIDRFLKPARLATAGCPYYWLIDPREPSISCYALRNGGYTLAAEARGTDPIHLTEPYTVTLVPEDLVTPY
ncbi:Uma2 family endonuclease [Kibdelosporangium aridum]|uniref:Uma2 family endonuclease n=1 Tax=Kibdelosporangium aridum TaxID=2030 RepID=UPI002899C715|nr:Uma2 family endonuclease [Kibdelosporangium aridum]